MGICSCSFHTADRIADDGREYDCVIFRKDSPGWETYRSASDLPGPMDKSFSNNLMKDIYFQGEFSKYKRSSAKIIRPLMQDREHGAQFSAIPDEPVTRALIRNPSLFYGWQGRPPALWFKTLEVLPEGAVPGARSCLQKTGTIGDGWSCL